MFLRSPQFDEAVRNPPTIVTRVEVWRGGVRVDPVEPPVLAASGAGFGSQSFGDSPFGVGNFTSRVIEEGDPGVRIYGGQVQVDGDKLIRRQLTGLKVDATDAMWDLLSPTGTELRVFRGFRYLNGETETVPVGRFVIDNQDETFGGDWDGQVGAAPDLMVMVQRAQFTTPRAIPVGVLIRDAIAVLLSEVLGPVNVVASSTAEVVSPLLFERDRAKAITEMCESIGAEAFIAADGAPILRDVPMLADPVWTVDTGDEGTLYQANRRRSRERTYSGVVATPAQVDGVEPFEPVAVWDEDPNSLTYRLGPFGEVPYFLTSPLLTTRGQAETAALVKLSKVSGLAAQLSLDVECHPALEAGDSISVHLPPRQWGRPAVAERHLIVALTVPLTAEGTQSITTRSTGPDTEDDA